MSAPRGKLVVMSGPSGSGKTTIKERLRRHPSVKVAVTVTTREPRVGERPDVDYHFVSRETFLAMKAAGLFVETNDVFGNGHFYGSLRRELEDALADPDCVYVMEVDVTGAANLRKAGFDGTFLFIAPPSMVVLERRLRERNTDAEHAIERRLARASQEMEASKAAGSTIVVNEAVDATVAQIFTLLGLLEPAAGTAHPAPGTLHATPVPTPPHTPSAPPSQPRSSSI
ncbi:MAG TPA: guanylate kinase [Planctomycetota bacterium]|nr:guanylate kinase [Planctomycetota bacterium]